MGIWNCIIWNNTYKSPRAHVCGRMVSGKGGHFYFAIAFVPCVISISPRTIFPAIGCHPRKNILIFQGVSIVCVGRLSFPICSCNCP